MREDILSVENALPVSADEGIKVIDFSIILKIMLIFYLDNYHMPKIVIVAANTVFGSIQTGSSAVQGNSVGPFKKGKNFGSSL
jgi:hypothetical protein